MASDSQQLTHTHTKFYAAPSTTVQLTDNGTPPTPGQDYSLTCELSGVNNGSLSITYQWKRDGAVVSTERTLSFSPLRLADAGRYTCQASLLGMVFSGAKDIRLSGQQLASYKLPYTNSTLSVVNKKNNVEFPPNNSGLDFLPMLPYNYNNHDYQD